MKKEAVSVFWFRRDLRLFDNAGLTAALKGKLPIVPVFIFDTEILDKLDDKKDARVQFIYTELEKIKADLKKLDSDLDMRYGKPEKIWEELIEDFNVQSVFTNRDYEPYARDRDKRIKTFLGKKDISFHDYKDQIIFDRDEVLKDDGDPYVVYTPYSKKWLELLKDSDLQSFDTEKHHGNFHKFYVDKTPTLNTMGFESFEFSYPSREVDIELIKQYDKLRNFPAKDATSHLSLHLRFGTVSIRTLSRIAKKHNKTWLNELIWRNFYQVVIWHFPDRIENAFKKKYDNIPWRDAEADFKKWCQGKTGYPIVDAGMRQLNKTGFMHNRLRMVTASFLTKHLLIDWRWGEAYFAQKLLDFDLASNNGGWQWAAGSGVDAAPYFRIFNPHLQTKKFDPDLKFINKWIPELNGFDYPAPMVEHKAARQRALDTYKKAIN